MRKPLVGLCNRSSIGIRAHVLRHALVRRVSDFSSLPPHHTRNFRQAAIRASAKSSSVDPSVSGRCLPRDKDMTRVALRRRSRYVMRVKHLKAAYEMLAPQSFGFRMRNADYDKTKMAAAIDKPNQRSCTCGGSSVIHAGFRAVLEGKGRTQRKRP